MIRWINMLGICGLFAFSGSAQTLTGSNAVELNIYSTKVSTGISGAFSLYSSEKVFFRLSGQFEQGRPYSTIYQYAGFDGKAFYNLLDLDQRLYLNIGAGPAIGYEQLKNFDPVIAPIINYGLKGSLELGVPLSEQLMIVGGLNQNYLLVKTLGSMRAEFALGFKIILN